MLNKATFKEMPDEITYITLPDRPESDIWIRKNITEKIDEETGETVYEADEAYMRYKVTEAEIESDPEYWFNFAAEWDYKPKSEPTEMEQIKAQVLFTAVMTDTLLEEEGEGDA